MDANNPRKTVLVAGGTGRLGQLVIAELLLRGARVRALVRDPGKPEAQALAARGVDLVQQDVSTASDKDLERAAEGVFAVVSALQGGPDVIVEAQLRLLAAARTAGARRFFPSDYSYNFFTLPEGVNVNSDWRRAFAARAAGAKGDVEVVHLMQGIFADAGVLGFVGLYDPNANVVRHWGDGTAPIDWTTWEDTARFLAAAALDERPVPEKLFVAGQRMSMLELAELLAAVRSRPRVEALGSLDDLRRTIEARLAAEPANMYAWLPLQYALGMFGGDAKLGALSNDRYPDIRAESVREALSRGAL